MKRGVLEMKAEKSDVKSALDTGMKTKKGTVAKKIILTGGGSGGHVTPNLALIPRLRKLRYDILYIGSRGGIEETLIKEESIPYVGISSGKLRRYFDLKNFTDPFLVIRGYFETLGVIRRFRPDVIFSKGGFVSVPVVYAAKRYRVPVILHESDLSPGLANKLSIPVSDIVCCDFPETLKYLPQKKRILTGPPIREELFEGSKKRGLTLLGFDGDKPVLLAIGGSLGSVKINEALRNALPELLSAFDVVHLTGKGHVDPAFNGKRGYVQLEFATSELKDIYAVSDICISRAGANVIFELLKLKKPMLLIPLSSAASRGDQVLNAMSFKTQGFAQLLPEEELDSETLPRAVRDVWEHSEKYIKAMELSPLSNGVERIIELIEEKADGGAAL